MIKSKKKKLKFTGETTSGQGIKSGPLVGSQVPFVWFISDVLNCYEKKKWSFSLGHPGEVQPSIYWLGNKSVHLQENWPSLIQDWTGHMTWPTGALWLHGNCY